MCRCTKKNSKINRIKNFHKKMNISIVKFMKNINKK